MLPPDGVAYLGFHRNDQHVAAGLAVRRRTTRSSSCTSTSRSRTWPPAVAHAVELGATIAESQPQANVRVLLDPDGHPFCLYT